jgi:hypothetical protein
MPGTPVIYYGDEIGMGDNFYLGDRNGVRTPMQWNGDRNAGFSRANPQRLYLPVIIGAEYRYEALNVEAQQNNPHSLLWWMKRIIALRKRYRAFGSGSLEMRYPRNSKVLVFLRRLGDERILVVANLSRFVQFVELDLASFRGRVPVELFGRHELPAIGRRPYLLTLGPHSFYWFSIERSAVAEVRAGAPRRSAEVLEVAGGWRELLEDDGKPALEQVLPDYLRAHRWFGGKARQIKTVHLVDSLSLPGADNVLALIRVEYTDASFETYLLPLAFASGAQAQRWERDAPGEVLARVAEGGARENAGTLFDATADPGFGARLLEAIAGRRRLKGAWGTISALPAKGLRRFWKAGEPIEARVLGREQSNTSVLYRDRLILKLFRRLAPGVNPDLEVGRFLTDRARFAHVPPVAGAIEYQTTNGESMTLGVLQGFVPNEGDAWSYMLDWLERFFDRVLSRSSDGGSAPPALPRQGLLDLANEPPAAAIVRGALRRTTLDNRLATWVVGEKAAQKVEVERWVSKGVLYLLMLFVLVGFFQVLNLTLITTPLNQLQTQLAQYAPRILGAAALLFLAWVIASVLKRLVSRGLAPAKIDERLGEQAGLPGEERPGLSATLADAVYWLVFLLFLPAVLGALALQGLLGPVQRLTDQILSYIPHVFAAALILIVVWFVARIVERIVTNLLAAIDTDQLGERVGLGTALGTRRLSGLAGLVVYILILIPVAISSLNALNLDVITRPASDMLGGMLDVVPALLGAALLLTLAFVVGKLVAGLVSALLASVGFNNVLARLGIGKAQADQGPSPSNVIGSLVLAAIMLLASVEGARLFGMDLLADLTAGFLVFAGRLALGLVIFGTGLYLANLAATAIKTSSASQASLLAMVSRVSIVFLAGAVALRHMGLADEIIELAFGLRLGALAVAFALAFGLGAREVAAAEVQKWVDSMRSKEA